ncbi:hypothetical protein MLD38_003360 [Melastoma candidum]|uniref:Uncharacterized protein n=1 Tax=Melastoma candidum TaxID=119954 RepID=A0ACB9S2G0_9MYRT|nr:hypothetical protein MLD38_003360 [Melastoma candidum]
MKSYNNDNLRFLPRRLVTRFSATVFGSILCSYPYWGPSVCNFLFVTLPCAIRLLLTPECLFFLLNAIISFLIWGSRLEGSDLSMPRPKDAYEEYIERSRSLGSVSSFPNDGSSTGTKAVTINDPVVDKVMEDKERGLEPGTQDAENSIGDDNQNGGDEGEVSDSSHVNVDADEQDDEDEDDGLGADELNKRAEEFIAKVNQQRWREARSVVCA